MIEFTPRQRGRRGGRVPLMVELDPDVRSRIDAIAAHCGIPLRGVVELAVRSIEIGPDGMPVGWGIAAERPQDELPGEPMS